MADPDPLLTFQDPEHRRMTLDELLDIAASLPSALCYVLGMEDAGRYLAGQGHDASLGLLPLFLDLRSCVVGPPAIAAYNRCVSALNLAAGISIATPADGLSPEASFACELYGGAPFEEGRCVKPTDGMEMSECARVSLSSTWYHACSCTQTTMFRSDSAEACGTAPPVGPYCLLPEIRSCSSRSATDSRSLPSSAAHQRAHWKTHKPVCFAPSW
jgi:hypothetical protein